MSSRKELREKFPLLRETCYVRTMCCGKNRHIDNVDVLMRKGVFCKKNKGCKRLGATVRPVRPVKPSYVILKRAQVANGEVYIDAYPKPGYTAAHIRVNPEQLRALEIYRGVPFVIHPSVPEQYRDQLVHFLEPTE